MIYVAACAALLLYDWRREGGEKFLSPANWSDVIVK